MAILPNFFSQDGDLSISKQPEPQPIDHAKKTNKKIA
jgi:hypothetical protein